MLSRFYLLKGFLMDSAADTVMTDDEVLDYTQLLRRKFVRKFTNEGEDMPKDPKEAKVLLTALSDMDRSALGKKRIKTDENIAQMNAQTVDSIAAEVRKTLAPRYQANPQEDRPKPVLNEEGLPPLQVGIGETEIGVASETHEAFAARYERENGKPERRDD